jgi:hypothetical protein
MGSNPPPPGGFNRCVFIEDHQKGEGLINRGHDIRVMSCGHCVMLTCYSRPLCSSIERVSLKTV